MRTVLTLAVLSLCGALGDLYLAKGMQQVGALPTLRLRALLVFGRTMARTGAVQLGVPCLIVHFVHFVLATLGAKWLLHEHISCVRWCGTLLVGLGVALLTLP